MVPCPRCQRHLREDEARCPFCSEKLTGRLLKATAVLLTPIVLAACYGPPHRDFVPSSPDVPPTGDAGRGMPPAADGGPPAPGR